MAATLSAELSAAAKAILQIYNNLVQLYERYVSAEAKGLEVLRAGVSAAAAYETTEEGNPTGTNNHIYLFMTSGTGLQLQNAFILEFEKQQRNLVLVTQHTAELASDIAGLHAAAIEEATKLPFDELLLSRQSDSLPSLSEQLELMEAVNKFAAADSQRKTAVRHEWRWHLGDTTKLISKWSGDDTLKTLRSHIDYWYTLRHGAVAV